jgi:hypothetical protein
MLAAGTPARRLRPKRACQSGLRKTGVLKVVSLAPQGPKATGERYLPKKARQALTTKEYAATSAAKREGTKAGKAIRIPAKEDSSEDCKV